MQSSPASSLVDPSQYRDLISQNQQPTYIRQPDNYINIAIQIQSIREPNVNKYAQSKQTIYIYETQTRILDIII